MRAGVHPAIRAEQALLGSVLADPGGQAWLLDLIDPADLIRPYHRQVLAAMTRARGSGTAPGILAVYQQIKKDPELPRSASHDGVLLASLMEAAPRPGHAPSYAAMVISTGIQCVLTLSASRMQQAAESGDASVAVRMAEQARDELECCQARWAALPEPMRRELPTPPRRSRLAEIASQLTAARDQIRTLQQDVQAGPPHNLTKRLTPIARHVAQAAAASAELRERQAHHPNASPEAETAGAQALRDLTAAPSQIGTVKEWLQPEHFARRDHRDLYAVMLAMTDIGKPIDPVTVTWEATLREIPADAAALADGNAPFAVASAREVHRHGVLAQVDRAAREIQAGATGPASRPATLLQLAADQLERLERQTSPDRAQRTRDSAQARDPLPRAPQETAESSREAVS
jgi:replicative DNA helicase